MRISQIVLKRRYTYCSTYVLNLYVNLGDLYYFCKSLYVRNFSNKNLEAEKIHTYIYIYIYMSETCGPFGPSGSAFSKPPVTSHLIQSKSQIPPFFSFFHMTFNLFILHS